MALPLALHVAAASQLLPIAAGLVRRGRPLPAPARWVLAWCGLLAATDAVSLAVILMHRENLWLQWVAVPLGSGLVLWALSLWQASELLRLAYRLAIVALAGATLAGLLLLGPEPMFEQVLAPIHALVLLAASLHTLLARALRASGTIAGEPWFWMGMGLSLY